MAFIGYNKSGAIVMDSFNRQQFIIPGSLPFLEIRTTTDSILPYAEHFHSSFSLGLIHAGRTRFSLGKDTYVAESGDIVLIAPEQTHSCNPVEKMPRSYQMAHLDASWFHGSLGMTLYQQEGLRVAEPLVRDTELFAKVRDLFAMARAETAATGLVLTALLTKMHSRYQCFLPAPAAQRPAAAALTERSVTERVLAGEYSVSKLAQSAGVRRESFSRFFRRTTGLPPSSYLHCLRLEYGRHLLQEGCSVAEAAAATGYVDQSHFHRMFVRYCSVTPGCYRKNQSHPYKK